MQTSAKMTQLIQLKDNLNAIIIEYLFGYEGVKEALGQDETLTTRQIIGNLKKDPYFYRAYLSDSTKNQGETTSYLGIASNAVSSIIQSSKQYAYTYMVNNTSHHPRMLQLDYLSAVVEQLVDIIDQAENHGKDSHKISVFLSLFKDVINNLCQRNYKNSVTANLPTADGVEKFELIGMLGSRSKSTLASKLQALIVAEEKLIQETEQVIAVKQKLNEQEEEKRIDNAVSQKVSQLAENRKTKTAQTFASLKSEYEQLKQPTSVEPKLVDYTVTKKVEYFELQKDMSTLSKTSHCLRDSDNDEKTDYTSLAGSNVSSILKGIDQSEEQYEDTEEYLNSDSQYHDESPETVRSPSPEYKPSETQQPTSIVINSKSYNVDIRGRSELQIHVHRGMSNTVKQMCISHPDLIDKPFDFGDTPLEIALFRKGEPTAGKYSFTKINRLYETRVDIVETLLGQKTCEIHDNDRREKILNKLKNENNIPNTKPIIMTKQCQTINKQKEIETNYKEIKVSAKDTIRRLVCSAVVADKTCSESALKDLIALYEQAERARQYLCENKSQQEVKELKNYFDFLNTFMHAKSIANAILQYDESMLKCIGFKFDKNAELHCVLKPDVKNGRSKEINALQEMLDQWTLKFGVVDVGKNSNNSDEYWMQYRHFINCTMRILERYGVVAEAQQFNTFQKRYLNNNKSLLEPYKPQNEVETDSSEQYSNSNNTF